MSKSNNNLLKLIIGILISLVFLYLAFRKIDLDLMAQSFKNANYWLFLPPTVAIFFSHWVRALRWKYFLGSIKKLPTSQLFSATLIGYMGNTVLPAHLGEVLRANVIGHRENIPTTSVLATLVIERMIDVYALLVIMMAAVFAYPFPETVTRSGYLFFLIVSASLVFLILLKKQNRIAVGLVDFGLKILPKKISAKLKELIDAFIEGVNGMEKKRDYIIVFILSIVIWFCYWVVFYSLLYAFNLVEAYNTGILTAVVLLVITTISIIVPSSPGYVGTYHFLCQFALGLFGVPATLGLSYAIIAHGISMIPVAIVGFILAWREGINRISQKVVRET